MYASYKQRCRGKDENNTCMLGKRRKIDDENQDVMKYRWHGRLVMWSALYKIMLKEGLSLIPWQKLSKESKNNNIYLLKIESLWKFLEKSYCWTTYSCRGFNPPALHCIHIVSNAMRISWRPLSEPAKAQVNKCSTHTHAADVHLPLDFRLRLWCSTSAWAKTQTLLSAEGCEDKSQKCCDLSVWPAQS